MSVGLLGSRVVAAHAHIAGTPVMTIVNSTPVSTSLHRGNTFSIYRMLYLHHMCFYFCQLHFYFLEPQVGSNVLFCPTNIPRRSNFNQNGEKAAKPLV